MSHECNSEEEVSTTTAKKCDGQAALTMATQTAATFELMIDEATYKAEEHDNQIAAHFSNKSNQVGTILDVIICQLRTVSSRCSKPIHTFESRVSMSRIIVEQFIKSCKKPKAATLGASNIQSVTGAMSTIVEKIYMMPFSHRPLEIIDFSVDHSSINTIYGGFFPIHRDVTEISIAVQSISEWPQHQTVIKQPWGLAVHPNTGNIYIVCHETSEVVVMKPNLDFLFKFGSIGNGRGELSNPQGIAISADGSRVAVVDYSNHRIQLFNDRGEFVKTVGKHGTEDGDLYFPYHATYDLEGCFYVTDINNDRVQKFGADGDFMLSFARPNTEGDVGIPYGVSFQSDGTILVIGHGQNQVKRFTTDGDFLTRHEIESTVEDNDVFRAPNGGFGVCFKYENKIKFYNRDGVKIHTINSQNPRGVAFGLDGCLYVASLGSNMVSVY